MLRGSWRLFILADNRLWCVWFHFSVIPPIKLHKRKESNCILNQCLSKSTI